MRLDLFEALAPVCPRCLEAGEAHPLVLAERLEMRAGHLWHGILHCSNPGCWLEYPVIDGIPVIVPDPRAVLQGAEAQLMARTDLPFALEGLLGDAFGPGGSYDANRQHLSLYAGDHYADWVEDEAVSHVARSLAEGQSRLGPVPEGPAIDLGASVGRGAWELARTRPTLGVDLNMAMLRLAQRLMVEGQVRFGRRRVGVVYDPVEVVLPEAYHALPVDFWAVDVMRPPFDAGAFPLVTAINVVDCVADPAGLIASISRLLAPGGGTVLTTPFDWAPTATGFEQWLGGHSQRGPLAGAAEPILASLLTGAGLLPDPVGADLPWELRLHERSVMHYRLHLTTARKPAG